MLRIRSPQNLAGSILLLVLGMFGLLTGSDLPVGTAARMGAGYFPILLSWLIVICGILTGVQAFAFTGPSIELPKWRPIIFILGAVMLFGFLINRAGLAFSSAVVVLIVTFAESHKRYIETIVLAVFLSALVVGVFVYALNLPIPVWIGG